MAGTIKGIIIEIGGDTSGLQKALSKVNSATSSLTKELKGVNALLKLDPTNTELVSQKQEILAQNIKETSEKLKILKQTQEQADEAIANGTKISDENYRNLQREIINTENKLKDLQTQASKWTTAGKAIEEYGNKIQSLGKKIDSIGNKLTAGLTLPILAIGVAGVQSAATQEAAMQQVEKIYGDAADTVKDFAENTALSFNMSTSDAYKYAQIYGNLIQSITDDEEENAKYTQELLEASSIIASATGRTMEDVMDRIRSGLLGNTEAIEDLGVNVNVAMIESTDSFKKFAGDKSWRQLDFQTQQQIRLFAILEQTSKKYGDEVNKNTSSDIQRLTARFKNLTSDLNEKLLPIANKLIGKAEDFLKSLEDLDDKQMENIINIGLMVAAAGPLVKILGTTTKTIGGVTKGVGLFSQAIAVATNKTTSSITSVNNLAKVISGLTSPVGIAATAIATSIGLIITAVNNMTKDTKEGFENIGTAATDFVKGIDTAESHLDAFNSTLFASSEEQQKLQNDMQEIQNGITQICKTASDERRDYTQEEITQLDEYFKKIRELKDREIEIQQSISSAIVQQAEQNAQTFQGSLEEYKINSQEWINTAQQQAEAEISLINERTTQEIALLQQRYGEKASLENEEYAREYNKVIEQKEKLIEQANEQVARVNSVYAQGYLERNRQEEGWYNILKEYTEKQENLQENHNKKIQQIKDGELWYVTNKNQAIQSENDTFAFHQANTWNKMYKNMSDEQEKELGVWLAMVAQTEMYGGEISEETKEMVDSILDSYDSMPGGTKKAMKNAMQPMLEEMQSSEPSLFAKASSIANGILTRLKKSFDINSPSKKTRDIFKNVMKGAELGLEDETKSLYKEIDTISNGLLNKLKGVSLQTNGTVALNNNIINGTKTVFTTPQIIFNVQELDEAKLEQCFNYINRKFGTQY